MWIQNGDLLQVKNFLAPDADLKFGLDTDDESKILEKIQQMADERMKINAEKKA